MGAFQGVDALKEDVALFALSIGLSKVEAKSFAVLLAVSGRLGY